MATVRFQRQMLGVMVAGLAAALIFGVVLRNRAYVSVVVCLGIVAIAFGFLYISRTLRGNCTTLLPYEVAANVAAFNITLLGVDANGYATFRIPLGWGARKGAPKGWSNSCFNPYVTMYDADNHPVFYIVGHPGAYESTRVVLAS
jgi:hypothetical protein